LATKRADIRLVLRAAGFLLVLRAPSVHAADCNGNRVEDLIDVVTGGSRDCNANLVPDECDVRRVSYGLAFDRAIPLERHATSVLAGDLDADGSPDLIAAHGFGSEISILGNDGAGSFGQATFRATQIPPELIAMADIEGDADPDLILAGVESVSFLRNDGDRVFSTASRFRLGFNAKAIAPADLDLDGDADLAVAGPFDVVVFLQAAGGAFEESQAFPVGSSPATLLAADLDGDGDLDLAAGNSLGNVSILLDDGAGIFALPRNYGIGGAARALETADMDGDGDADLVTIFPVSAGSQGVQVLENAGDGSFEAGDPVTLLVEAVAILPADTDGDGDVDLVLPAPWVAFVQNHGGNLGVPELFPIGLFAQSAAGADLDGDGSLDIVEVEAKAPALAVLEKAPRQNRPDCNRDGVPDDCQVEGNDCNGNRVPDDCDVASGTSRDCNANGKPDECDPDCNGNAVPDDCDVAARTSADCNANGIPDECDLLPEVILETPREVDRVAAHGSLHAVDLDGDVDLDLVTVLQFDAIRSFTNSGAGTFEVRPGEPIGRVFEVLLAADLEADGDPDLVLGGQGGHSFVSIMVNDGTGRFANGPVLSSVNTFALAGGDLDGDGDLDLVFEDATSRKAVVNLFSGGAFEPAAELPAESVIRLIAGDFDADGDLDVAGVLQGHDMIRVFLNDGDARFPSFLDSPGGNTNSRFTPADLDGDGDLDLVEAGRTAPPDLGVHFNGGDGRFSHAVPIVLERFADTLAASDLDGDGDLDLAAGVADMEDFPVDCAPTSALAFLVNDGGGGFTSFPGPQLTFMSMPFATVAGDLDGDGLADVAMLVQPVCHCCIGPTETSIHVVLNRTVAAASRDLNVNHVPDECEGPPFRRGDSNADARFDITDAVAVLLHLFRGGPEPTCASAADSNGDARVDIADPIHLLLWLFAGGPEPPPPGPACGHDPDPPGAEGNLGCASYEGC
jgi:hypothetical protein